MWNWKEASVFVDMCVCGKGLVMCYSQSNVGGLIVSCLGSMEGGDF